MCSHYGQNSRQILGRVYTGEALQEGHFRHRALPRPTAYVSAYLAPACWTLLVASDKPSAGAYNTNDAAVGHSYATRLLFDMFGQPGSFTCPLVVSIAGCNRVAPNEFKKF